MYHILRGSTSGICNCNVLSQRFSWYCSHDHSIILHNHPDRTTFYCTRDYVCLWKWTNENIKTFCWPATTEATALPGHCSWRLFRHQSGLSSKYTKSVAVGTLYRGSFTCKRPRLFNFTCVASSYFSRKWSPVTDKCKIIVEKNTNFHRERNCRHFWSETHRFLVQMSIVASTLSSCTNRIHHGICMWCEISLSWSENKTKTKKKLFQIWILISSKFNFDRRQLV